MPGAESVCYELKREAVHGPTNTRTGSTDVADPPIMALPRRIAARPLRMHQDSRQVRCHCFALLRRDWLAMIKPAATSWRMKRNDSSEKSCRLKSYSIRSVAFVIKQSEKAKCQ